MRNLNPRRVPGASLAVMAALAMGGCAPTLRLSSPDPGVPARFAATAIPPAGTLDATQVHWRAFFKDPRLHVLIDSALAYNRDLRIAAARVEEARAQWALARADQWPSLQLFGRARLDRTYAENLSLEPARRLDLNLSSASFELDFFGRLQSLSEAARANFLATDEARRATELALVSQVAELYLAQRQLQDMLARARVAVTSRTQTLEILGRARDIGMAHDLELEQAQVQLETARAQRAQLGLVQQQTDNLMRQLVGPLPERLPEGLPLDRLVMAHELSLGVPAEVLLLRPDVMAAEQRLAAAQANVKAARAAFFPRIALTANIGTASAGLMGLFKAGAWAFQPTVSIPLFDAGRNQAGWDLAKARELAVVAQYERTVQQAFREVADQLAARASLAIQASAADRSLQAQQHRLQIQRQRYQAGLSGYLEVLESERELLVAEQSQVAVRRSQLEAMVGLYKALGGGAPAPGDARAAGPVPAAQGERNGS
jgi:multidrug efflux system outer membrane protein